VSDLAQLAHELASLGVQCVFGIPGEGPSLHLLTALEKLGVAFQLVPHEAAGALMAAGFASATGTPGVAISIKGPGFGNMLAGITSNWLDRQPVLTLSESYGPGSSSARMHKRIDHCRMVRPVVKAYWDNCSPELLPKLWHLCGAEEPGPVHLDISARMDQTPSIDETPEISSRVERLPQEAARLLRAARRPAVIVGSLANRRQWRTKLNAMQVPVLTTVAGKGAIDESLPHAGGVFTNSGGAFSPEKQILPKADLILGLGLRVTELIDIQKLPAPLVALDELSGKARGLDPVMEALADAPAFDEALDIVAEKAWGKRELDEARSVLSTELRLDRWLPAAAFRMLQDLLPDESTFFMDTGNFCVIGEHVLVGRRPLQVMGSTLARSMGVALPRGTGAALAAPGRPVVVAVGDGGICLYPEVLSIAVQKKLPVILVLMKDGFYSSIREVAIREGLSEEIIRVPRPSWTGLFESMGCPSHRVGSKASLETAVRSIDGRSGPMFLELEFDAEEYMAMTGGIR